MSRKIYILTFHWATNYGAVLQSYALQRYLIQQYGNNVEIINYIPKGYEKTFCRSLDIRSVQKTLSNVKEYYKEKKIKKFREKNLIVTREFKTSEELLRNEWEQAVFIAGSDQIWNPFFTMKGENKPVGVYYLDFAPEKSTKISYAVSFGTEKISEDMQKFIQKKLEEFNLLTVRENSGHEIISRMGLDSKIVCDPVFLHKREFYEQLFSQETRKNRKKFIFSYILHGKQENAERLVKYLSEKIEIEVRNSIEQLFSQETRKNRKKFIFSYILHGKQENAERLVKYLSEKIEIEVRNSITVSIEEWLRNICDSKIVVTNSFHAVAFSLIFQVPFIAVLIEGSGMNDRILTLLKSVNLEDRAVLTWSEDKIDEIIDKRIDWENVNERIDEKKSFSRYLLEQSIRGENDGNL